tara:strand:- start:469 stop:2058 length:1590 start_codon:yes stop_codon:yes gene_type:complete
MADEKIELEIKSNTKETTEEVKELNEELKGTVAETKDLGKQGSKGTGLLSKGFKTLGGAMKAAGIGLIVALLAKLGEVFGKNQKVVDTFNAVMETLTMMFQDLFSFLSNNIGTVIGYFKDIFENPKEKLIEFGEAIKRNLIERFMSLLEVFGFIASAIKKVFAGDFTGALEEVKKAGTEMVDVFTGVDDTVGKVSKTVKDVTAAVVDYTKSTFEAAKANVELRNNAEIAAAKIQGLIEKYDREAEIQRQIRDDSRLSFAERIAANEELGRILEEQAEQMLKLADTRIAAAAVDLKLNQGSIEAQVAYQDALNERAGIEAQITGIRSEQINNLIALEQELKDVQQEVAIESEQLLNQELLNLKINYDSQVMLANKAGLDITNLTKKYEKQKSEVVANSVATQLGAYSQLAGNLSALAGDNKALAVAQAIIDTYAGANKAFAQGGTLGFVTGAAVIAGGLANVRKILQTDVGGGGGGGNVPTDTPQMIPASTGAFTLEGGIPQEPVKAFVVESEITDSQAQMADINRRSTI